MEAENGMTPPLTTTLDDRSVRVTEDGVSMPIPVGVKRLSFHGSRIVVDGSAGSTLNIYSVPGEGFELYNTRFAQPAPPTEALRLLALLVEVFADGTGTHPVDVGFCSLTDEGHDAIAEARRYLAATEVGT